MPTYGYRGKLLRVNLTTGKIAVVPLSDELLCNFVGGRGLGAALLLQEVDPTVDPLGPENKMIFLTGPLTGTNLTSTGKTVVTTKSPLTNIYLDSLASGYFGQELKFAGWDGLIIEGVAASPSVLVIQDERVEIRANTYLWGMNADDAQRLLTQDLGGGNVQTACIGPAGERLVRYAAIMMGHRAAGRGGGGAVMGGKKLKAIAVVGGDRHIPLHDEKGTKAMIAAILRETAQAPFSKLYAELGSSSTIESTNPAGMLPSYNYRYGTFEHTDRIDAHALRDNHVIRKRYHSCPVCSVGCSRLSLVKEGPYAGTLANGPEYETVWAFGPQVGNDNLAMILAADALCDRLGLDTISAGNTIGFAMECYEKGVLSPAATDGLDLSFGNEHAIMELVRKIAYREGVGDLLAEGSRRMAEELGQGSIHYAIQVKGMELAGYDPRGSKAMGLVYAAGSRGGCHHNLGYPVASELSSPGRGRFGYEGKAALVKQLSQTQALFDSLPYCMFARGGGSTQNLLPLWEAATGLHLSPGGLAAFAERVMTAERVFNVGAGVTRKDDVLPGRFSEPMPAGPVEGEVVDLTPMLDDYYTLMGWDSQGTPRPETLERLGFNRWLGRR